MDTLFFIASKVFWLIARPESLLVALLGLGLLFLWRGKLRAGRRMIGAALIFVLAIGALPVGHVLLYPLENRFPAEPPVGAVAGIVVLGGGETPEHTAAWDVPQVTEAGDRFLMALALADRYPDAPVLFAGGSGQLGGSPMPEAEVARQLLIGAGLDPARLLLEPNSRNTAENAENALTLRPDRAGNWLLVTSAFHMPRSVGAFCAAGWGDVVAWPTDYRTARLKSGLGWDLAGQLATVNTATKEWVGLLVYWATGRSHALFPSGCP